MSTRLLVLATLVPLLLATGSSAQQGPASRSTVHHRTHAAQQRHQEQNDPVGQPANLSEGRVIQIPEDATLPLGVRAPEVQATTGTAKPETKGKANAPIDCSGENASSPACYTATQQGTPTQQIHRSVR
jgi:hypothetical protein